MLQEYYTIIIPILFAIISVLVKLLSRRDSDSSPKRNDTCIGQSMMLGALSASLIFVVNAGTALRDLRQKISSKESAVKQANDNVTGGSTDPTDLALLRIAEEEKAQVEKRGESVGDCQLIACVCMMLVLGFAAIDRYYAFEEIKVGNRKSYHRKWEWWAILNVVGVVGFVTVLLFTKQGK